MGLAIDQIIAHYGVFSLDSIEQLDGVYERDVIFIDPITEIHGLPALKDYLRGQAKGLIHCEFHFHNVSVWGDRAALEWDMKYRHRAIGKGRELVTSGISMLEGSEKIERQRDYYDLGSAIYEHVPILGAVVRAVKRRL